MIDRLRKCMCVCLNALAMITSASARIQAAAAAVAGVATAVMWYLYSHPASPQYTNEEKQVIASKLRGYSILVSTMQQYRAANPDASFVDFLREVWPSDHTQYTSGARDYALWRRFYNSPNPTHFRLTVDAIKRDLNMYRTGDFEICC